MTGAGTASECLSSCGVPAQVPRALDPDLQSTDVGYESAAEEHALELLAIVTTNQCCAEHLRVAVPAAPVRGPLNARFETSLREMRTQLTHCRRRPL